MFDRSMRCAWMALAVVGVPAAVGTAVVMPTPAMAAVVDDLTAAQQTQLDTAVRGLDRLEQSVQVAESGIGRRKPTGSRLKLAQSRLEQAMGNVAPVEKALAGLPADHADVKAASDRLAELKGRISAMQTTLGVEEASPEDDDAVKLGYQQEDQLKGAKFNLDQAESATQQLEAILAEAKAIENKDLFNYRKLAAAREYTAEARRKAGFAAETLEVLPANGRGVAAQQKRLDDIHKRVGDANQYLTPIDTRVSQLIDMANYPDFNTDHRRVEELGGMFRTDVFGYDLGQAAEIYKQMEPAREELIRIAKKYLPIMLQKTPEGEMLDSRGSSALGSIQGYQAAAEQQRQTLPGEIRQHLAEADRIAAEAVAEQKPLFFTGGVPQEMGFAEERMALYAVLATEAETAKMQAEVDAMQASIKKRQESLRELIIRENTLPTDRYAGDDKPTLVAKAIEAWKRWEPDAEVLMVILPSENWKRETMWRYSNGTWYKIDRSRMQAQVILKHDSKLAVNRPVNLWINHISNDELTSNIFDRSDRREGEYTAADDLLPSRFYLMEKLKKAGN